MKPIYLIEITSINDQKISETTPRTFAAVTASPCSGKNDSRMA
jgi:hypothetical protein